MTIVNAALALGGIAVLGVVMCLLALRRHRVRLAQAREEMEILLRQCQTEYRDGFGEASRAIASLEISGQRMEDALRGRFTRSFRAKAMQLLSSGNAPDKAAAELGIPRSEMRLLARVSHILRNQI